jgi:hypothetical protein
LLRVKKPWVRDLLIEMHRFIDRIYPNTHERRRFYGYESEFIKGIERVGVTQLAGIEPRRLFRVEFEKNDERRQRWALGFFGRFLETKGYWSVEEKKRFDDLLKEMYDAQKPSAREKRRPGVYRLSPGLAKTLQDLTINCGLHSKEIRSLRVGQIEQDGIRLGADRVIPFGTGPHMITRRVLESWLAEAQPQDLIFYQRRPRDYSKPMGSDNLLDAVRQINPHWDLNSVRQAHFREDFRREKNLRKVRLHLTQFHCLERARASGILRKLVQQSQYFIVPEPFLLAVLGASRLLPCQPQVLEGGRQCTAKWKSLLGRYDVTITWPTSFARQLQTISLRVATQLIQMACDFWKGRCRINRDVPLSTLRDKSMLSSLALTRVEVRDNVLNAVWGGTLFEPRCRNRYFSIPLIESMEGGIVNGRCPVCRHRDRQMIDKELVESLSRNTHIRGFSLVARKYGIPYRSIFVHAGTKKTGTPYYDMRMQSHLGTEAISQTVRCPIAFLKKAHSLNLIAFNLYVFLLLLDSGEEDKPPCVSPDVIRREIGLELGENVLLQGLNDLRVKDLVEPMTRKFLGIEARCVGAQT